MIELRFHHVNGVYHELCLSDEERARTPEFNHENVYGKDFALKMDRFMINICALSDETRIKIVGALDDICKKDCPIKGATCEMEDKESDYEVPNGIGLKIGDIITAGELKRRLKEFYHHHDPPWKEAKWQKRLALHPHLSENRAENFWLTKIRKK